MRVAFVDFTRYFFDRHSLYCISAFLKRAGIEVLYISERSFEKALEHVLRLRPDVLLYSAFEADVSRYGDFDALVKSHYSVHSIMGGPAPTYDWGLLEHSSIDALCVGEGEQALLDYLTSGFIAGKNIIKKGKKTPEGLLSFLDLDSLPFPDRGLVYDRHHDLRSIETRWFLSGRGCPYQCAYCCNDRFHRLFLESGPRVRKKSVGYLIEEILDVRRRYPVRNIIFQDDIFVINEKWLFEFCEQYEKKIAIPYTCQVRASLLNEKIVRVLKRSGCVGVMWSIESGNDYFRNFILKRNETKEEILAAGRLLNQYGISFRISNIIGLPGEDFRGALETLELNIKVHSTYSQAGVFVPQRDSELTQYAIENGFLDRERVESLIPAVAFRRSVLNIKESERDRLERLSHLFPFLTAFPSFYYSPWAFHFLLRMPMTFLIWIKESFRMFRLWRIHGRNSSMGSLIKMARRWAEHSIGA